MKELTLNEMKEIEFAILKIFDSFCKENNIRYCLAYGTLLGAIRYKKFIPWDDDVDVLVPRADYDRLLTLFKDSEQFKLFAYERNKKYHYPYAKLCDMTTRVEYPAYKNRDIELGVDIDIFPLDAWDSDLEEAKKEAKKIYRGMNLLFATKTDTPLTNSKIKKVLWKMIMPWMKRYGGDFFVKRIIKRSKKHSKGEIKYLGAKSWCVYGVKGIIPAEAFADTVYVEFEGQMFPAPAGYDTYLTCLYGDYLPEPPKEKQKSHHVFKAYRL